MKATRAEISKRVEQILEMRLRGVRFSELREHARPWNISRRTMFRYIHKADNLLEKHLEKDRDKVFNLHVGQRRLMYRLALAADDIRTALAVLRDEAKLCGLYNQAAATPCPRLATVSTVPMDVDIVKRLADLEATGSDQAEEGPHLNPGAFMKILVG